MGWLEVCLQLVARELPAGWSTCAQVSPYILSASETFQLRWRQCCSCACVQTGFPVHLAESMKKKLGSQIFCGAYGTPQQMCMERPPCLAESWVALVIPTCWSHEHPRSSQSSLTLEGTGIQEINPFLCPSSCIRATGVSRRKWCPILARQQLHFLA